MPNLKITMAQLNPTVGEINANAHQIEKVWSEYDKESDLILFPELFLCGYPCEDLVLNNAFIEAVNQKIDHLCKFSQNYDAAALIPTIYREGDKLYNAALLIENGEIKHIFKKHKLPNYAVFDEIRTFNAGDMPKPYMMNGVVIGFMICEDAWHAEVPMHLKSNGAELLISINASPFSHAQKTKRINLYDNCVAKTGLNFIYLNMIGGQDELVFDGRSFIKGPETIGKSYIYKAPSFEEDIACIEIHGTGKNQEIKIIKGNDHSHDSDKYIEDMCDAIVMGIEDYVRKNGFKDVIIGLSGGIDSALTAALAVDALGADNVRCIMLPSEFTSQESLDDAQKCANLLGVQYDVIPIKDAVKTFESLLPDLNGTAHENTQSRIRGTILMAISNMTGAMLLTTGNKSEMAVGYCTLYGDMNGGYNPLKDVYKTDVYNVSRWINMVYLKTVPQEAQKGIKGAHRIPQNIIDKEPSAELRENQTDQDSLPPYDVLDDILYMLIDYVDDQHNDHPKIQRMKKRCEENPKTVVQIAHLLKNTEFKRFQSAPGVRLSAAAFGTDRRYPMTNHFVNRIAKDE